MRGYIMKRYGVILSSVMLFSSGSYGVNTYSYLWVTSNNAGGQLSYTGPSLTDITGTLNALYTGTMRVAYVDCSTTANEYINYNGTEHWVFIPSFITMGGKRINLTPEVPSGYTDSGKLPSGDFIFKEYKITPSYALGGCSAIGNTYAINYTYPEISIRADVSGLAAGAYSGTIPVRMAYADYFVKQPSDVSRFADTLAYNNSSMVQIPYNINITNVCQVSPSNITIDHGRFGIGQGNGNFVKKDIQVTCEGNAQLTINFQPLTSPTQSYTEGVGVGLGHGFDAVVQIGNLGLSNISPVKNMQIQKGMTIIPLTSTIHEGNNSSVGTLYGTANLNLTVK